MLEAAMLVLAVEAAAADVPVASEPDAVSLIAAGDRLGLAWIEDAKKGVSGSVRAALSTDGGATFGAEVSLSPIDAKPSSMGGARPGVAFLPDGTLLVAWAARTKGGSEIHLSSLSLSGSTSDWVVAAPSTNEPYAMGPDVGVDAAGNVVVAWNASGEGEEGTAYVGFSSDGGKTLARTVSISGQACPCCPPSLVVEGDGTCHLGYRAVFDGGFRDPAVVTVRAGEPGRPVRVHADRWKLDSCPASGIALALIEGGAAPRLAAAWYSGAGAGGLFVASGRIGEALTLERIASPAGVARAIALSTGVARPAGVVVWTEPGKDKGALTAWAQPRLFEAKTSARGGDTGWAAGRAKVSAPALSRGNGAVRMAWVERGPGGAVIRVSEASAGRSVR